MTIIDNRKSNKIQYKLHELPVGTVIAGSCDGKTGVFLVAYCVLVHLDNPKNTWSFTERSLHTVTGEIVNAEVRITE